MLFVLTCSSCRNKTTSVKTNRGFYFWKSVLQLSAAEKKSLAQLHINTLYTRFFDVSWNDDLQSLQPVAKLKTDTAAISFLKNKGIKIVPVVFITNESLSKIDSAASVLLAKKIVQTISDMLMANQLEQTNELQLDCDWTASTGKQYFRLLKEVKQLLQTNNHFFSSNAVLSATIRLHQVKYRTKSGIPPVDKGLLMCYNMGNLKNPATNNSIIDEDELKKYTGNLHSYPLQLDIALPLFRWNVLFRNNLYKGIVADITPADLTNEFVSQQKNRFRFLKDTVIKNIQFQNNDELRFEDCNADELLRAAKYLSKKLHRTERQTILLYHLDASLLHKHPDHELEILFRRFR